MASCQSDTDRGYATAMALVLSLALALVVGAITVRGVNMLKLARADLERLKAEHDLAGAQLIATATVIRSARPPPYHWTFPTDEGWIEARAELENEKLNLTAAAELSDESFAKLGVDQPSALKAKLKSAEAPISLRTLATLSEARVWRDCANMLISARGQAHDWNPAEVVEPGLAEGPPTWRVGETWRIRTTTTAGWRDERVVRFTGDARNPAATVERWFSRGQGDGGKCDALVREELARSSPTTATP